MKIAVVVQARMSSTRLPGKVLRPLAGAPSIVRMIERLDGLDATVATSVDPSDDQLAEVCAASGIRCVRGDLNDVLGRLCDAVPLDCEAVVRLTGDCPLIDSAIVRAHIAAFEREQPWAEYVTNALVRTQPDGLDVEVVRRDVLERARNEACTKYDREHVTPWVRRRARTLPFTQEVDLSALRWTLDTPDDYDNISAIYDALHPVDPSFDSGAVYQLLVAEPQLIRVAGIELDDEGRRHWVSEIRRHIEECDEHQDPA